uniref:Uncharacterized protein n=1 Tax=Anguilla anguilla TaxID=7936 RepID=A0A0E9PEU0_ANGAN
MSNDLSCSLTNIKAVSEPQEQQCLF